MRFGITGTESSHVDHVIDALNVRHRFGDSRVVALAGGDDRRNTDLARVGGINHVVERPEQLLGLVDAVFVADRHGGRHRDIVMPFLSEGLPVLVDKPLALTVEDARAMIDTARRQDALLTSASALRWLPDTDDLVAAASSIGPVSIGAVQAVVATGPADPASEYGGIFFYGIHPVDVALRLAPGPVGAVSVHRTADTVVATAPVGGVEVRVHLVRPDDHGRVPFHGLVVGRTGLAARELRLDEHYLDPTLDGFLAAVRSGVAPISDEDLLRPVEFLAGVHTQLGGLRRSADPHLGS